MTNKTYKKLMVGSAQFGSLYGISNLIRPDFSDVSKILDLAKRNGINSIDTAVNYGDAESILGRYGVDDWRIITKLPNLTKNITNLENWVQLKLETTLKNTKRNSVEALLLHNPQNFLEKNADQLFTKLLSLKKNGLINKIGISIYEPLQALEILKKYDIDIIQVPFNVFDQRILKNNWLVNMKKKGIEIHVRSIFLQGLLLMEASTIPIRFKIWDAYWKRWVKLLNQNNVSALHAALKFVLSFKEIDKIIVGVASYSQLKEILLSISKIDTRIFDFNIYSNDPNLINPSLWKK